MGINASHTLGPDPQVEFHEAAGTHPGEGWIWITNGDPKDRDTYITNYTKKFGKDNVLTIDTVFAMNGERWDNPGFSLWIRKT